MLEVLFKFFNNVHYLLSYFSALWKLPMLKDAFIMNVNGLILWLEISFNVSGSVLFFKKFHCSFNFRGIRWKEIDWNICIISCLYRNIALNVRPFIQCFLFSTFLNYLRFGTRSSSSYNCIHEIIIKNKNLLYIQRTNTIGQSLNKSIFLIKHKLSLFIGIGLLINESVDFLNIPNIWPFI